MEYDELIDNVQEKAELDSREQAVRAVQATLGTVGELLPPKERHDLAAELSKPLKEYLTMWMERPSRERMYPHRFSLEEFYNRVSARSDLGYPTAVKSSQAVIQVLKQAVSAGELGEILRELPDEYEELFSGTPKGPLSPSIVHKP